MRPIDADSINIRRYTRWFDSDADARQVERMIREAQTITPPHNVPLTLEELQSMGPEDIGRIEIIEPSVDCQKFSDYIRLGLDISDYGKTWLVYRRKPKDT